MTPNPGRGEVDVSVRVLLKMGGQLCFERGDLGVERGDDRDLGSGRRGESGDDGLGCGEGFDA
jgi:hypothetical protein